MTSEHNSAIRVSPDTPEGVAERTVRDSFPLRSIREFLLPDQVLRLKTFAGFDTASALDDAIDSWISTTQNIVAVPGPVTVADRGLSISLLYLPAVE